MVVLLGPFQLGVTSGKLFPGEPEPGPQKKRHENQKVQSCSYISLGLSERHFWHLYLNSFSPSL